MMMRSGVHDLLERLGEVADQRAADAAGVHFGDLDTGVLQKAAVNGDLAELVLDEHELLSLVALVDELADKSGLARTEEAGKNVYSCHGKSLHVIYFYWPRGRISIPIGQLYYYTTARQAPQELLI